MRRTHAVLATLLLVACQSGEETAMDRTGDAAADPAMAAFAPLPTAMESADNPSTPAMVELGRMLYYDTRLSTSGDVSCYVCHPLHDYGTSHRRTGVGHDGRLGPRNEPTVYNAAGHVAQFWDGRSPDVEDQALGPVLNPVEMGMPDGPSVVTVLRSIPGYVEAFRTAFPDQEDPVTFQNFGRAVGAFERGLVTPSRWDAYLQGDEEALTAEELHGFDTFNASGCTACHNGPYVGGQLYRKAGLVNAWFDRSDGGRVAVTGDPADSMVFKVPSLRNVEETWPYFHDGSVQRLQDAVRLMAWHQSGMRISDDEARAIVAWLRTLSGDIDFDYVNEPELPPSPEDPVTALE